MGAAREAPSVLLAQLARLVTRSVNDGRASEGRFLDEGLTKTLFGGTDTVLDLFEGQEASQRASDTAIAAVLAAAAERGRSKRNPPIPIDERGPGRERLGCHGSNHC